MENETQNASEYVSLTADIVGAYLTNNNVAAASIPELISTIHGALTNLGKPQHVTETQLTPAVPVKKSVTPDYIISLEDGRHYKSLKRHLNSRGMSPQQYREKWGLARDYPMVAENYAKRRSELALALGLGRKRAEPESVAAPAPKGRRKAA